MGGSVLQHLQFALSIAQVSFREDEDRTATAQKVLDNAQRLQWFVAVEHDHNLKRVDNAPAETGDVFHLLLAQHVDARFYGEEEEDQEHIGPTKVVGADNYGCGRYIVLSDYADTENQVKERAHGKLEHPDVQVWGRGVTLLDILF